MAIVSAPLFPVNEDINKKLALVSASITHIEVDAIVNAATEILGGVGGIGQLLLQT